MSMEQGPNPNIQNFEYEPSRFEQFMAGMRSRTTALLGAGAIVAGGGGAALKQADEVFAYGDGMQQYNESQAIVTRQSCELDETGRVRAEKIDIEPSIKDPRDLGKITIYFNERLKEQDKCPDDFKFETRFRLRTLGEGQTKWRTGDWTKNSWGEEADGQKKVAGVTYGMACDTKYRDYIKARAQSETVKEYLETTSTGETRTKRTVVTFTEPMKYARKIDCKSYNN